MTTPATRMTSFVGQPRAAERARVVVVSVLALELDVAADGQPVEGVLRTATIGIVTAGALEERLGVRGAGLHVGRKGRVGPRGSLELVGRWLAAMQHAGSGREADRELQHLDPGQPCHDEVTELVDQDQRPQHEQEHDDRDQRLAERDHAAPPTGPVANADPDLAVQLDQGLDVGLLIGVAPEAVDGGLEQDRDLVEPDGAGEEPFHRDVVGGDQRGGRPAADPAGLARDAQRRESCLVGRTELEPARGHQIRWCRRRPESLRIGEGVLDGKSHVGGAQLGLQRAVDELDGRVHDALGMDDDLDRVVADIVQPVCLDHLQPLVGERRRVDRDLGAHRPRRVAERLLGGDRGQVRGGRVEERSAGGREQESRDRRELLSRERLPDRRVLGVDRTQPCQR